MKGKDILKILRWFECTREEQMKGMEVYLT
jgi:hypothetical protein